MRLIFCFSRSCFEYSDILRRRAVLDPCWPGGVGRRSTGHFSVKHLVPLRKSFVPSLRHCLQLGPRSEEHTSELQSPCNLVCRLLLEKKKKQTKTEKAPTNNYTIIE